MRNTQTRFTISGCLFIWALIGAPLYVSSATITGSFDFAEGTGIAEVFLAPTIVISETYDQHGSERELKPDWKGESGKPIVRCKVKPDKLTKNGKIGSGIQGTYTLNIDDKYLVGKEKTTYIWGVRLNEANNLYELQRQTVLKPSGKKILQGLYQKINEKETITINIKIALQVEEPAHKRVLALRTTERRLQDQQLESAAAIASRKEKKDEIHVTMTTPHKTTETPKPQGSAPVNGAAPFQPANGAAPAPTEADSDNAAETTQKIEEPAPAPIRKVKAMNPALAKIGNRFQESINSAAAEPEKAPQRKEVSASLAQRTNRFLASAAATNSAAASGENNGPVTKSVGIPLVLEGMSEAELLEIFGGIKLAKRHESVATTGLMGKVK